MFIDFEAEEMIIPKNIIPVTPSFKGISAIINHYVKDGILVKRIEAAGKQAILYNGYNNDIAKIYKTEFVIINALFVTFTPKTPEDYLCLIGTDEIDFYALKDGMYCSIALPFKVSQAHPSNFGLILERSSFPGEFGNTPGVAQLFSLTHPYNEILPILCKFKGDSQCHYAFRHRRIAVVPKDIGANWSAAYSGQVDLVMCYDHDERTNHILMIRKCTKEERMAAKSDLGILNSSALLHTPSTIQSYYSPNFFNRRFVETRFAPIGLMNAQQQKGSCHQSPAVNSILFPNSSHSNPRQQQNNSIASIIVNTANSSGIAPSKTPIRRITRSMTAAFTSTISGGPSLPSSGTEKSPAFHRSLEHNATLNRMRLKQKLAMAASHQNSTGGHSNNIFHTPRHAASFTTNLDMDDLLSFGGKEEDDEPPPSLDMAVEFCLEWIWSEPPPCPTVMEESSTRSASTSSVGTEKVANKLETLRVSSSTSSHSDEIGNSRNEANRMASTFFISKSTFARTERCIVFHIPADRRVRVLSMDLTQKPMESPLNPPVIKEMAGTFIRGNSAIPFLHSSFFIILDNFSFSDSISAQSSIISLYSGHRKIANIPLNIGMSNNLIRLLPGVPCPDSQHLFEIRIFADNEENNPAELDGPFHAPTANDSTNPNIFSCQLQLGFATKLANRCLRAIYAWIGPDQQFQFLSNLFCSNPWRMVSAAQKIPFVDELPAECLELGLLLEQLYLEYGHPSVEMPFFELINRIRSQIKNEGMEGGEECSATKRTRMEQNNAEMLKNDNFWNQLKLDQKIAKEAMEKLTNLGAMKYVHERLRETLRRIVREERRIRPPKFAKETSTKKSTTLPIQKWINAPKWTMDLRVHNVQQMLDSSLPILIPAKAFGHSFNEVQQREQNEQFLLAVALRTVTRPFGRAALNLRIRHGFEEENDAQMGVKGICLNGRVHPGWQQIDFPLNDTNPSHKNAMDWANFYNALAHGISYCGGFPARLFTATTREENFPSTVKAGLLLAAGLTGSVRNAMNLYDIHALLTQSDRHLVIALLIGCAAASRGTSEVHIYKMIATHLPFLLQPTLCEFRIELVIQTAALVSLGLLFSETANYTVSSQLLNQMALEVPCESDQSFERYSFVLAAGMAIGLINLAKGKEITDTEIPISFWPSLKDRLVKMLNGGERKQAYLNYDRIQCPGMRMANGPGCSISRKYAPGGMDGIAENNNANNNNGGGGQQGGGGAGAAATNAANNHQSSFSGAPHRDYSGIGHPTSSHVRELPTLNIHLTAPAAAIALGLMYLRTGDAWIRETLSIKDTFYEIDKNRPDMLMIRTICRCLVDFDDIKSTKEWAETQIPEIVRKYVKLYLAVKNREDLWWNGFVEMDTVAKAYFYCLTGACLSIALRFASTCDAGALESIYHLYELLHEKTTNSEYSWSGLVAKAGRNCVRACQNVLALCLGLVMAGSGDLQTTRLLRKIRNSISENLGGIPPKDSSVHSLHVSVNMALGFLYLGHGRFCFSNSNLAIASLVLSLFPLFPHSITDNRFYFQPIRFLWVLAVKPNSKQIQQKMNKESHQKLEEEELVDCPRCGQIKITKNDKFIFD